ncbi:peptidase C19 family protein [Reticulomyxa filosa]|uniref:Peptidase C19 family protein n=1 Tax=Reticulomyxa filosa TaxID=46433 RepID=X6NSC2_RETFI|nr:peptidase C19 family protein [Reticulomyxa filosa]|eukprot:ETO28838.1 peptidase C19 family protein [Reticulomyxa filosa]
MSKTKRSAKEARDKLQQMLEEVLDRHSNDSEMDMVTPSGDESYTRTKTGFEDEDEDDDNNNNNNNNANANVDDSKEQEKEKNANESKKASREKENEEEEPSDEETAIEMRQRKKQKQGGKESLRMELQRIHTELKNMNRQMGSVSESMNEWRSERIQMSQSVDQMLRQITQDINLRISQQIKDEIDREIFTCIVKKVTMYFFDSKIIRSDYVNTRVVFESTVMNFAMGTVQLAKDLLNNVPILGIVVSVAGNIASTCGDWHLSRLFENVLNFEVRIGSENVSTFAKLFGLRLLLDSKFQVEKQESIKKYEDPKFLSLVSSSLRNTHYSTKPYIELTEIYCDRLFTLLTTETLCLLWEQKANASLFGSNIVSNNNNNNNNSMVSDVRTLESLVEQFFPALVVGEKNNKVFKDSIIKIQMYANDQKKMRRPSNAFGDRAIASKPITSAYPSGRSITSPVAVVKEGTMKKERPGIFSLWEAKFFRLFKDGTMQYSDKPQARDYSSTDFKGAKVDQIGRRFDVVMSDKTWKFECSSTEDAKAWVHAINQVTTLDVWDLLLLLLLLLLFQIWMQANVALCVLSSLFYFSFFFPFVRR